MPIPDFIVRLRQKIGHDPLWLSGATAVVLSGDEVLLVKRADTGGWSPVTGIVDPGEHPAQTAVREVLEETGVCCAVESLVWVNVTAPTVHANVTTPSISTTRSAAGTSTAKPEWPTTSPATWAGSH